MKYTISILSLIVICLFSNCNKEDDVTPTNPNDTMDTMRNDTMDTMRNDTTPITTDIRLKSVIITSHRNDIDSALLVYNNNVLSELNFLFFNGGTNAEEEQRITYTKDGENYNFNSKSFDNGNLDFESEGSIEFTTFNQFKRLTSRSLPDNNLLQNLNYEYNSNNELTILLDDYGNNDFVVDSIFRNSNGEIDSILSYVRTTIQHVRIYSYENDLVKSITTIRGSNRGVISRDDFTYDAQNRLTEQLHFEENAGNLEQDIRYSYVYDNEKMTSQTFEDLDRGTFETYTFQYEAGSIDANAKAILEYEIFNNADQFEPNPISF